jgi:glucosyl-3-phosphoglycerate synthase
MSPARHTIAQLGRTRYGCEDETVSTPDALGPGAPRNGRAGTVLPSADQGYADWRARRSYEAAQFPLQRLLEAKRESIALVLPAREVAETIGPIAARAARLRDAGLLDEVLVIDAGSRDGSAQIAAAAGLEVVQEDEIASELGPALGKGDAMWRALQTLDSEIVAYLDTDTEGIGDEFITGLVGPLVYEPDVHFVKGCFRRPFRSRPDAALAPEGGGRVTELMARPLLNLYAPELAVFDQPLAGETAARRGLLEQIPFSAGYGVEIAMLIDAYRAIGLQSMAQVDLGVRQNRHQPLRELSAMAYAVLVTAQARFADACIPTDLAGESAHADTPTTALAHATISLPPIDGAHAMEYRRVAVAERPPRARFHADGGG